MFADAIAGWPHWGLAAPPRLVEPLAGGRSNRSWLVEGDGQSLVVRYCGKPAPGADHARELDASQLAARAGISPRLFYANPAEGLQVTEYIAGAHWQVGQVLSSRQQQGLLDLLDRLHRLPVAWPAFDYRRQLDTYWRGLEQQGTAISASLLDRHRACLAIAAELPVGQGLCHHDLVPENIRIDVDGKPWLLDWEYAGNGCMAWDFATVQQQWPSLSAVLPLGEELRQAGQVYSHCCTLWELLTGHR